MSDAYMDDCGCCEGIRALTPAEITNAPGLPSIAYRVGTYNSFRQTMLAGLSTTSNQSALSRLSSNQSALSRPNTDDVSVQSALSGLNTRSEDDFSIALLDAWAVVCDVLTFYQERIANESYTSTSTERVSLSQLARSVSYELGPGVAADTHLAFTLEDTPGSPGKALIDIGTKVQSLPKPGEKPQVFETVEGIEAYSSWNAMHPLKTRSQTLSTDMPSIVFKGISTNLKPGDVLLIVAANADNKQPPDKAMRRIKSVVVDNVAQKTTVYLEDAVLRDSPSSGGSDGSAANQEQPGSMPPVSVASPSPDGEGARAWAPAAAKVGASSLTALQSLNGDSRQSLSNALVDMVMGSHVLSLRDLTALATLQGRPVKDVLALVAAQSQNGAMQAPVADETGVYVLRTQAALFGHNAPDWQAMPDQIHNTYFDNYKLLNPDDPSVLPDFTDWPFVSTIPSIVVTGATASSVLPQNILDLDRTYPQFLSQSWVAVMRADGSIVIAQVDLNTETSVINYTLNARVTRLKLLTSESVSAKSMQDIRQIAVYGQSEKLVLADLPLQESVQGNTIKIPGLYDGLTAGKMLMVAGELANLTGMQASEIVILEDTVYDTDFPGGLTRFSLKNNLLNAYKPETVTVYGNIARATQGETVQDEILGDGDASQPYQRFTLRQSPLTYEHNEASDNGITSTLEVYVDGIQWKEVSTLVRCGPRDQVFTTHTGDDGKTVVQFGDGRTGARLPDGLENVHATYRKGSGSQGQVDAGQLTQLMTRPLGVKSVTNPQAPVGAEDPESTDEARNNASLTVLTLDRIVSVEDYENLARSFTGIAKVKATTLLKSNVLGVFVTLAGTDGKEITVDDPLYGPLYKKVFNALRKVSDPAIPLTLQSYRKALFRLAARIKVEADYAQADVLVAVQQTVRTHFSLEMRSFGQGVTLKEVTLVIEDVPGVVTADVYLLYRVGNAPLLNKELSAVLPTIGQDGTVSAAELLMADNIPFDALEVIP